MIVLRVCTCLQRRVFVLVTLALLAKLYKEHAAKNGTAKYKKTKNIKNIIQKSSILVYPSE